MRAVARLQPLTARQRKAKRGDLKSATANHAVYLLQATLRATTRLQHFTVRSRRIK
ncbi:hypothetical protein [Pilibacter termitis]|uniref:hypothetical protein n=1 Tax=Pilibacter termitis TaxID=263852 RepID=UPI0013563E1F|nr:hypothetical protein [Pilibacter termitis]